MKQNKTSLESGLDALTLFSQLGLSLAIPIILGALSGHWLDEKLGTGMIFFVILLCLGIAGGFYGAYYQIMLVTKKKKN